MKTQFKSKEQAAADRKWILVDAQDKVLGRLASQVAHILRGKHKPCYNPHNDTGDFVVVVNAEKIAVTGGKELKKKYYRHTGYVGGIKDETLQEVLDRAPEEVLQRAVKGMLPKNSLGRTQLKKLKIYVGSEHPHEAQKPEIYG